MDVNFTSSTAQGGGGSFQIVNLQEKLVVVNHGWQSKITDGYVSQVSIYLSLGLLE